MRKPQNILVAGGCGFIGANFIHFLLQNDSSVELVNLDKLIYPGMKNNLTLFNDYEKYHFYHGDICDFEIVSYLFDKYKIDTVVNFAAETHVDRSIKDAAVFVESNVKGAFQLLEGARRCWQNAEGKLFLQVSTDEVYGTADPEEMFDERSPYRPRNPYSATKAAADHLAKSYFTTYGLPVIVTNSSNNYGPYQYPEKLVPLMVLNAVAGKPLPLYGDGTHVRDWLYVDDHCRALWALVQEGQPGEQYNIASGQGVANIDLLNLICAKLAEQTGASAARYLRLIQYVADRPGHDRRYALDCSKICALTDWKPLVCLDEGIALTVKWYLEHPEWAAQVMDSDYEQWMLAQYGD